MSALYAAVEPDLVMAARTQSIEWASWAHRPMDQLSPCGCRTHVPLGTARDEEVSGAVRRVICGAEKPRNNWKHIRDLKFDRGSTGSAHTRDAGEVGVRWDSSLKTLGLICKLSRKGSADHPSNAIEDMTCLLAHYWGGSRYADGTLLILARQAASPQTLRDRAG